MSDNFNDHEDDEEEEGVAEDDFETLPTDTVLLSGLQCLDEDRIFACGFVRASDKPCQLNVEYTVDKHSISIIGAPFERFASEEAYYILEDDAGNRVSTIIMQNLKLIHMEMGHDVDDSEELRIYMVYQMESFEQQMTKQ